jgi:hypothetical protein
VSEERDKEYLAGFKGKNRAKSGGQKFSSAAVTEKGTEKRDLFWNI